MKKSTSILATAAGLMIVGALVAADKPAAHSHAEGEIHITNASVLIVPKNDSKVQGWITLTAIKGGVELVGEVSNLTPGKHGFHVHEFGDIRDATGKGAGGHYNPDGHAHGGLNSKERHAGDLGNIVADEKGVAKFKVAAPGLVLHHVLGRSLVIHAGEDDLTSQPSGDSGDRVGVGVIGLSESPKPAAH